MTAPGSPRDQRRPAAPAPADQTTPRPADELRSFGGETHETIPGRAGTAAEGEILGTDLAAVRTGDDTRRRGWFWHWNSIVTQYAPLIGLKGVGLLNSYTVWTDRRESSPMRGYAFPSQQSEADFYGEDRAELIAINKILVALDLIEIKKEMVLRVDEHGHRWRVPHNLYRVKDTDDSRGLTTADVRKVTELAERDPAVYRHVRRVFSARFAPIDPANVWHAILPEVRQDPAWQRLAAKTAREEERFSARSKAGHASRRASAAGTEPTSIATAHAAPESDDDPDDDIAVTGTDPARSSWTGDSPAAETTVNDTTRGGRDVLRATAVASGNDGLPPDVGPSNDGLGPVATIVGPTAVGPTNRGGPTDVAPSNTIEDQPTTTTTTTLGVDENDEMDDAQTLEATPPTDNVVCIHRPVTGAPGLVTGAVTTIAPDRSQAGPGADRQIAATEVDPISVVGIREAELPVVAGKADGCGPGPAHRLVGGSGAGPGRSAATVGDDALDRPLPGAGIAVGEPSAGSRARRQDSRRQDEALALTAFEAANGGRVATPAEVQILRQLAGQLDPAAATDPELPTGWAWLAAAIYEAVDAGSAYVAPRRIREIATRWQREGRPGARAHGAGQASPPMDGGASVPAHPVVDASAAPVDQPSPEFPAAMLSMLTADRGGSIPDPTRVVAPDVPARRSPPRTSSLGTTRDADAANPASAARTAPDPTHDGPALWEAVLRELARDLDPARLVGLTAGVEVARVTMDEVDLAAPPAVATALAGEARPLLTRALSVVLRRTVRLTIRPLAAARADEATGETAVALDPNGTGMDAPRPRDSWHPLPIGAHRAAEDAATMTSTPDPDLGLSDAHLWAAVVDEVVRAGDATAADVSAWLKPARIAGRTPAGAHVVVAPSESARRRLDGPLRPALETALARVLGPGHHLEITTARRAG